MSELKSRWPNTSILLRSYFVDTVVVGFLFIFVFCFLKPATQNEVARHYQEQEITVGGW